MLSLFKKKIKVGSLLMEVPKDMSWCFANNDYYEINVIYWLDRITTRRSNSVLYDIGANYGYFTLRYASVCSHVYAFEPVSRTYEILGANISKNRLVNVTPCRVALSDSQSEAPINLYSSSGNNSLFHRILPGWHSLKCTGEEIVSVTTLDLLLRESVLRPPDILKIDVEGAELSVVLGGLDAIATFKPFIIVEYGAETCRDAGYNQEELRKIIEDKGYDIAGLSSQAEDLTLYSGHDFARVDIANLVCIPKGESI